MVALNTDDPRQTYLEMHQHLQLKHHYSTGTYGGLYLGFSPDFRKQYLPKDSTSNGLQCTLLDQEDGKKYTMPIYVAYEHEGSRLTLPNQDWNFRPVDSLMPYWYGSHHCP